MWIRDACDRETEEEAKEKEEEAREKDEVTVLAPSLTSSSSSRIRLTSSAFADALDAAATGSRATRVAAASTFASLARRRVLSPRRLAAAVDACLARLGDVDEDVRRAHAEALPALAFWAAWDGVSLSERRADDGGGWFDALASAPLRAAFPGASVGDVLDDLAGTSRGLASERTRARGG